MKTKFLTFANEAFLPKALVCKRSLEQFYSSSNYDIEIVHYDAEIMQRSAYLQGFAETRIKIVRNNLTHYDCVVMLGADCVLYSNIDAVLSIPGKIVLVPHVITPPSNAAKYYLTGHANGDVVCFRNNALDIVDWLLGQPMRHAAWNGMFFEQTLLSSLPFIFEDVAICKDPTVNYAYYNFHERKLEKTENKFFVNERPLALCQFSGYLDGEPEKISRYYRGPTPPEDVLTLFREYEERLKATRQYVPR